MVGRRVGCGSSKRNRVSVDLYRFSQEGLIVAPAGSKREICLQEWVESLDAYSG
jgi:hypothetical protein